ncbi:hypothetical protein A5790_07145 [Mycobacterium sp. 852002-51152_SCH6134967]|uniref:hypothetical protein n=1 Tax=Mycobacterium sp. 852002-51152_SCH6134967 TaxID=1834096 RepID=UPI00080105EF|nr:hypothetical protein [Mycobacterium sp. 852002-51152_SCH6134967]OBF95982.1 hypothetical protein A5790_07145 [Mycobacterium sp. 852002-51152_SCH6134967]
MSNISENDRIEDVTPGDIVLVDRGAEPVPSKVVHKDVNDGTAVITYELDDGTTFQVEYAAGTRVTRSLEAKWESEQSPTQHKPV